MIQSAINSLLTTAGRAYVAAEAKKIAEGKKEINAIKSELAKTDLDIVDVDEKQFNVQKDKKKANDSLAESKKMSLTQQYRQTKALIDASDKMSNELAMKKTQLTFMKRRLEAKLKMKGNE